MPVGVQSRVQSRVLGLLVLSAALTGGVVAAAAPALAEAPLQHGWWTTTNTGTLPVSVPPPDVPAGGMLVEGGATSPSAYGAVVYEIGDHVVPSRLTLTVAAGSGTVPGSQLELC